jgi:hypothetical protein
MDGEESTGKAEDAAERIFSATGTRYIFLYTARLSPRELNSSAALK